MEMDARDLQKILRGQEGRSSVAERLVRELSVALTAADSEAEFPRVNVGVNPVSGVLPTLQVRAHQGQARAGAVEGLHELILRLQNLAGDAPVVDCAIILEQTLFRVALLNDGTFVGAWSMPLSTTTSLG